MQFFSLLVELAGDFVEEQHLVEIGQLSEMFGADVEERSDRVLLVDDLVSYFVIDRKTCVLFPFARLFFRLYLRINTEHPSTEAVQAHSRCTTELGIMER